MSALTALAAAVAVQWMASEGAAPWLGALALAATLPALSLLRLAPGDLRWDGGRFRRDGAEGTLEICVDLGAWMLLRWRPAATARPWAVRWLPVSARAAGPAGWHALRCALHAPAVASDG